MSSSLIKNIQTTSMLKILANLTTTVRSIFPFAVANADGPTLGTAKPSASVGLDITSTGYPALIDSVKEGHCSDSTP